MSANISEYVLTTFIFSICSSYIVLGTNLYSISFSGVFSRHLLFIYPMVMNITPNIKKKKLNELTIDELKKVETNLTNEVLRVFDLKNSVNSKKSYGGTAFENIKKMIIKYKKEI